MTSPQPGAKPTAVVIVAVLPTDQPGTIALSVVVDGPAKLTLPETTFVLRSAADTITQDPTSWQQT